MTRRNPLTIADRMGYLEPSGIRRFFDLARTLKNPIDLSIGQAHYEPPAEVIEGAVAAMRSGKNRYTATQGIEPLRVRLREKLAAKFPLTDADELMITAGVSGGLVLTYLCTLNPGDEIMVPDPYFVMYKHLAHVAGAVPKFYSTFPSFEITRQALESAWSPKTRAIICNSPSNPTGYVISEAEARLVGEFAKERGLLLITDEIYDTFIYDRPHVSPRRFCDHTMVLGGFSKSLGIPGWRMGYALGPANIIESMRVLSQFSFVCAPQPAQWAVLAGLDLDFGPEREAYRKKRDLVYESLSKDFEVVKPEGAFYIFPKLPAGVTDEQFVGACIERGLIIVPGSACCSRNDYVRLCYAAEDSALERAMGIMREVVRGFGK